MRPSNRQQTTNAPEWHDRAACRGLDASVFYPADDDDEAIAAAKAVCAQCPVADVCLEHALQVREKNGVWGGYTERDRRRIVRQRRRAVAAGRTADDAHPHQGSDEPGSVLTIIST